MSQIPYHIIQEAMSLVKHQPDLKSRLQLALWFTIDHPQLPKHKDQFLCAVVAVSMVSTTHEQWLLLQNVQTFSKVAKFIHACATRNDISFPTIHIHDNQLGLLSMWSETKRQFRDSAQSKSH